MPRINGFKQRFFYKNINMNRYILTLLSATALFFSSCGLNSGNGELIGVQGRKPFKSVTPYGMVYVPSGSFLFGQSDQDIAYSMTSQNRQITISAFYMDETEVTNNEYRQFVHYVRDSIAHKLLGGDHITTTDDGKELINWKEKLDYSDPENTDALNELYYEEDNRIFGRKEFDPKKLVYEPQWIDFREASIKTNRDKPRNSFIKKDKVEIYPDTLTWLADFTYAMNEPMVEKYFWHPAYDEYPVVGVTWRQARAFCVWRTKLNDDYKIKIGEASLNKYELPTETQFEYAARGGRQGTDFPWGGPYIKNAKGCLLANFKPGRGNYIDDGGFYTVKVNSYFPNDYGLYNMAGNVAEWTASSFDESASTFVHDLNPTFSYEAKTDDPENFKRKVVRGGSWKDVGYYLMNGTRSYEFQDTAKSYLGFRCVMPYMGRDIADE